MQIVSFIREAGVIDKILAHIGYKFEVLPCLHARLRSLHPIGISFPATDAPLGALPGAPSPRSVGSAVPADLQPSKDPLPVRAGPNGPQSQPSHTTGSRMQVVWKNNQMRFVPPKLTGSESPTRRCRGCPQIVHVYSGEKMAG